MQVGLQTSHLEELRLLVHKLLFLLGMIVHIHTVIVGVSKSNATSLEMGINSSPNATTAWEASVIP